jgi:hypothetical protein
VAGRSYVAYGIGPSLLMLPLVALWGPGFNQAAFNAALGGLAVALWWSITGLLSFDYWKRLWLTALFAVGALFCFAAGQSGSTWNLMHVTTVFGLTLAIHDCPRQPSWMGCRAGLRHRRIIAPARFPRAAVFRSDALVGHCRRSQHALEKGPRISHRRVLWQNLDQVY